MAKKKELNVLELLKMVLPKTVEDPKLAQKIFAACEKEISGKERVAAFEKLCQRTELPNLEKSTLADVTRQLETSFGSGAVSLVPHPQKKAVSVEVVTDDGTLEAVIEVGKGKAEKDSEEEEKAKFVAFPVALEADAELVWVLGRDERMTPQEAAIALAKIQEGFWESKAGQQHLRNRTERTFPEFIAKIPGKLLTEVGLKRHYKDPEPLKTIKVLKPRKQE